MHRFPDLASQHWIHPGQPQLLGSKLKEASESLHNQQRPSDCSGTNLIQATMRGFRRDNSGEAWEGLPFPSQVLCHGHNSVGMGLIITTQA